MFGFFIKKNFCDVWDNLLHIFVVNLVIMAGVAAGVFLCLFSVSFDGPVLVKNLFFTVALFIASSLVSILIFAECENASLIANFRAPTFKSYFSNIVPSIKDGVLFGLLVAVIYLIASVALPYYFNLWIPEDGSEGSIFGLLLMAVVFWFLVITVLSLQYFFAIRALMGNPFFKTLKKCFILFFDNTGFTILLFFKNLFNVALSILFIVSLGTVPGIASICLSCTNALRLRLYKYDWLEVNPDLTPKEQKDVPWKDLIAKDKRTLGPRKFKSFIFPWKD